VKILLRADSGFAQEELMAWCETHRVDCVFGLARNERLIDAIVDDLVAAEAESLAQGGPARGFADFFWTTRESWSRQRRVVAKAEHLPKGPNPSGGSQGRHWWSPRSANRRGAAWDRSALHPVRDCHRRHDSA
jgi:hypothetical protein